MSDTRGKEQNGPKRINPELRFWSNVLRTRVSSCAPGRGDSPFAAALLTTAQCCNSPTGQPTTHKRVHPHDGQYSERSDTGPGVGGRPEAPSQMKAATHGRTRVVGSVSVSCPDQANPDRVDLGARGLGAAAKCYEVSCWGDEDVLRFTLQLLPHKRVNTPPS